jgi:hypothetical protein
VACCVYLRISAIDKPSCTHCNKLRLSSPIEPDVLQYSSFEPERCSIYETRPEACRAYSCAWLHGLGAEQDRPDKCGILIDTIHQIENALECKPLGPGLQDTEDAVGAVLRMCRDADAVGLVFDFCERRIMRLVGRPL